MARYTLFLLLVGLSLTTMYLYDMKRKKMFYVGYANLTTHGSTFRYTHSATIANISVSPTGQITPVEYFSSYMASTHELIPNVTTSMPHTFVIYIMTAMTHINRRSAIRRTWTNSDRINSCKEHGFIVERMFVVGGLRFVDDDTADKMRNESKIYNDILTIDALSDDYLNLTKKTLYTMYWINDNLYMKNVDYMMKADDDILLNIFYILRVAWTDLNTGAHWHFICALLRSCPTPRTGKYAEQLEVYPDEVYPQRCQGAAYTYHIRVFNKMLSAIPKVPIMRNEDAMLTGVCLRNITLNIYNFNRARTVAYNGGPNSGLKFIIKNDTKFPTLIYAHELPIDKWNQAFNQMNSTLLMGDYGIGKLYARYVNKNWPN